MSNQRGFIPIVIILVVLGVLGFLIWRFVVTQLPIYGPSSKDFKQLPPMTTDPTRPASVQAPYDKKETLPNGKIRYTNIRDNYQIDLPENWQIELVGKNPQYGPTLHQSSGYNYNTPNSPDWYGLDLRIRGEKVNREIKTAYETTMSSYPNIKIDGLDTVKIDIKPKPQADVYYGVHYTLRKNPKYYYDLEFGTSSKQTLDDNTEIINQIINSFSVLDKTEKPVTLITFTNPTLSYSFKYPNNWLVNTYQNSGNYNLGITVVDEDDQEMLSLFPRPGERDCSTWGGEPVKYDLPFQNKSYHMLHHIDDQCPHPYVKTKDGYEYRISAAVYNPTNLNPKLLDLLNSIEGLTLIPRSRK